MRQMITPAEALGLVLQQVTTPPPEVVPHVSAWGRALARDIVSEVALPPFDNSAMDGYAVHAADLQDASQNNPICLSLLETIAAGAVPTCPVAPGTCSKIMTGAPLPGGADAVVMREETRQDGEVVEFFVAPRLGESIRRAGSDVRPGETVLRRGNMVGAAQWGMLASLGCAQVEVFPCPRVAILTTGEELATVEETLQEGQIRDSNSWTLEALARECGAEVVVRRRVGDDPAVFKESIKSVGQSADLIVTSGGVSAGDFDPVRDVLPTIADVHFWKIAMKPGKPVMFATLTEGERTIPVFGLPGNPVSVMVAFELFVRPALLQMQARNWQRVRVQARIDAALKSPLDKAEYVRAQVVMQNGDWLARLTGDQGSGRLSTMVNANALLKVPVGVDYVAAGETLTAHLIDWPVVE